MPPQQTTSAPPSAPPEMNAGGTSHLGPWMGAAALVAILILGGIAYWYFGSSPGATEPKTIGVIHFRQQHDAFVGFKKGLEKYGLDDVIIREKMIVVGPDLPVEMGRAVGELLDEGVDLLWLSLELQAKVALEMTRERGLDTPIVFLTRFHDPVEYGLVESFRSSGNNAAGGATNMIPVVQRTIEFFKEINPEAKRIGIFSKGFQVPDVGGRFFEEWKTQAPRFGMQIVEYTTSVPPPEAEAEFHRVAATIKSGEIDGLVHIPGHFYDLQEKGESELAIRLGIPMASPFEDMPNGGHFTYTDNFGLSGEQSVAMIDKIFKGAKPSDIPVEYGAESILILHLGRAAEADYDFSDNMLFIARHKLETDADFAKIEYY